MKLFLIITFALITVAVNKEIVPHVVEFWRQLSQKYKNECVAFANADPLQVDVILTNVTVIKERSIKCYLSCIYKKLRFLKPDGKYDEEEIVVRAHYVSLPISRKCAAAAANETDLCEIAYGYAHCLIDNLMN
ncbi:hypothetical protein FQA39_LY12351 [Lamprigera yunnana]|nr:hypothetical protein FQA39_LY12351 [Lamprigera yunnana]